MRQRAVVLWLGVIIAVAAVARPDTKIVQTTHQDSFSMMGQTQPAKDEEQVLWIGADRMRLDSGTTSVLDMWRIGQLHHSVAKARKSQTVSINRDHITPSYNPFR